MQEQKANSDARVLVFAGSTRVESVNRKLAAAAARMFVDAGLPVTLADLRNFPMPLYEGDMEEQTGIPQSVIDFQELVKAHDALVVASPEYNGSFSALVKNALDWISIPAPGERPMAVFRGKIGAVMSASPGRGGGQRGLRHLRELLEMLGVSVIAPQVAIANAHQAFGQDGSLLQVDDTERMQFLLQGLQTALTGQFEAI